MDEHTEMQALLSAELDQRGLVVPPLPDTDKLKRLAESASGSHAPWFPSREASQAILALIAENEAKDRLTHDLREANNRYLQRARDAESMRDEAVALLRTWLEMPASASLEEVTLAFFSIIDGQKEPAG